MENLRQKEMKSPPLVTPQQKGLFMAAPGSTSIFTFNHSTASVTVWPVAGLEEPCLHAQGGNLSEADIEEP